MEVMIERVAGLDVAKDSVVACVRAPSEGGEGRGQQVVTFGATTPDLLALGDWLESQGVTLVVMESTGVYWKPVYHLLEDRFEVWLANARHLANVPGRKTDVADAVWIAQLAEHGLVRPSFVPPRPIRELRNLCRYRRAQVEERTREAQRLDKVLQDAGIKLSSVASNSLGVSGRAMLEALVAGTRDPQTLAELAQGRLRAKLPALKDALEGRFGAHHALLVGAILAKLDFMEEAITALSEQIDQVIAPFEAELAVLDTIPGIDRRLATDLIAEIGVDMGRFPTGAHLASWAGMCPGQYESAGKQKGGRARPGNKWVRTVLTEAATSASRSKDTYLAAQYHRLVTRRGKTKARKAVGHSILVIAYHLLSNHVCYQDLGADWHTRLHPQRTTTRLIRQLNQLGYKVTLDPVA